MKKIKTLTLAGLIGLIAMAAGTANPAAAQTERLVGIDFRPIAGDAPVHQQPSAFQAADQGAERGIIAIKPGELLPAIKTGESDTVGRKAGDLNGFSWGAKPGEAQGVGTPDTMPTDQKVQKVQGLGSLNALRSTNGLFANSRGGDQGNGPLLLGVRGSVGGTQQAHGAGGGGGAGKVQMQDIHFNSAVGGQTASGGGGGAGAGKTGETRSLNFSNNANAGGSPTVTPGAAKGLNFAKTVK